uniref:CBF domain-containing protein n=2 Tax=Mesocestoides corti TaxID=53468 RepID=A0A5K3EWI4_MESCO
MAEAWFSESCSNLRADNPNDICVNFQESHAKNIFEKYFVVNNNTTLANADLYGAKSRVTQEWLSTVLLRGTSTDRVLALAFMVRARPLSSLQHLDQLIGFISPLKKQLCMKAIDVLTNLFESTLLPTKRILISLESRPFDRLSKFPAVLTNDLSLKDTDRGPDLPRSSREYVLALWYFEHRLKQSYLRFLTSLENVLMNDTIPVEKTKALNALITLVSKKPENREVAIGMLVNKLGDRSKSFASSVIHKLRNLCRGHPNLKVVLVEQLRSLLFRPNLVDRAKYYAIVLLSCIPFSKKNPKAFVPNEGIAASDGTVAAILFKIYLSFFRASVVAEELPERLIAALLTGISRAAPYLSEQVMAENVTDIDAVFRLVHVTTNFTISLQTLNFLFHFTEHQPQLRDRYYQALYRRLNDVAIRWSARCPSLLSLVFHSLLADGDAERRAAIVQRLLSICLTHPNAGFVAGAQILLEKLRLTEKINVTGSVGAPQLANKVELAKQPKRLLPTSIGIVKPTNHHENSDSEEEHFSDIPASDDEGEEAESVEKLSPTVTSYSWDHRRLLKKPLSSNYGYDSSVRDPRYARARGQPLWQLILLSTHVHPTINLFARSLIEGKAFKYTGDPFDDLSVAHFMERFVYKKPKSSVSVSKTISHPGKSANEGSKKVAHAKTLAPDSLAYRNLNPEQVPSDERFIHSYLNFVKARTPRKMDEGSSDESDQLDEDFDEYLARHEKGLIPNDADEDEDFDDADFDYSSDDDANEEAEGEAQEKASKEGGKDNRKKRKLDKSDHDHVDFLEMDDGTSDDYDMSDDNSDDDFRPLNNSRRSGKFDLNKIFVSAEEVGDLYDSQEVPDASSKRAKWQKRHLLSSEYGKKRLHHHRGHASGSKKRRR